MCPPICAENRLRDGLSGRESYVSEDGRARIPIVFDNLIAKHDMP